MALSSTARLPSSTVATSAFLASSAVWRTRPSSAATGLSAVAEATSPAWWPPSPSATATTVVPWKHESSLPPRTRPTSVAAKVVMRMCVVLPVDGRARLYGELDLQDHFAELAAGPEALVRLLDRVQGVGGLDRDPDPAGGHRGQHVRLDPAGGVGLLLQRARAQGRAEQPRAPHHQRAQVQLDHGTGSGADDRQPAPGGEQLEVGGEVRRAHQLQDHVEGAGAGQLVGQDDALGAEVGDGTVVAGVAHGGGDQGVVRGGEYLGEAARLRPGERLRVG